MRELRQLARGIYPPVLHDFGLPVALRAPADRSPLPVSVSCKGIGRYPEAIEAAVYYCAREAIRNATKHAGPGANVAISLAAEPLAIRLSVDNDGIGMTREQANAGMGIIDMSDRIEAVGGVFEMISAPGHGASISRDDSGRRRFGRSPAALPAGLAARSRVPGDGGAPGAFTHCTGTS